MTDREEYEKTKHLLIGAKVKFPEKPDDPDQIGTVTDVYLQPAINVDEKPKKGLIFVSPDEEEAYPNINLRPKILCRVQFDGCFHITEPDDLIIEK